MELTEKEKQKAERNKIEDKLYKEVIDKFLNKGLRSNDVIKIGTTPFCLRIVGAGVMPLVIYQGDLRNCMENQIVSNQNKKKHSEPHDIPVKTVKEFSIALRNPICICKGNTPNTLLVVSDLVNKKNENIVFPIHLSVKGRKCEINQIESAYGKKNIQDFLQKMYLQNKILAIHKEKIEKCFVNQSNANIGRQLPKFENIINLDDSIAYSTANVKYPDEKNLKGAEKEMTEQEMQAAMDELRKEFEEKFSDMEKRFNNLSTEIQTINKFVSAMTEAQGFEQTMGEIESVTKQLTGCEKAIFYCYDSAEDKFFSNDDDYRSWQDSRSAQELKSAFDSGEISSDGQKAIIPLVSAKGETVGVIEAEKEQGFTASDFDYFKTGSQIISTVELALNKEFEHQGRITDELTGLKNRQGLNEYISNTLYGNINADKPVSLVMCDIDHFKSINDTYGHDAGDIVLKNIAEILQDGTRSGSDCAFRFGGEEMIVIFNCEDEQAYEAAERLRQEVEKAVHTVTVDGQEKDISVTISMGVHQMQPDIIITPENARDVFDTELKQADSLLYTAKETGRNKVVNTFDINMAEKEKNYELEMAKAYNSKECHAYVWDKNDITDNMYRIIAAPVFSESGGNVGIIIDTEDNEKLWNDILDILDRRDNYEENKSIYEQSKNNPKEYDLAFGKTDDGTVVAWNKSVMQGENYTLIAKTSPDKSMVEFYENVPDDVANKVYETIEQTKRTGQNEKENFCLFTVEIYGEVMEYRDNTTSDINALMNRYVECEGDLLSFTENCTQISSVEFAELEQYYNPLFCAEINVDENSFSVWDNEKFADESLENVISSIKENGTVNLDYQEFAENNDTAELTSEYLDLSASLDNAYDDFLYHSGIFNDEHIAFVDKHGQLPDDLNAANNRDIVTEYINIQLESGSNLSESQKETLTELKNQISEIREMETKLGIDENDLSFIAETKNACTWTYEAQKKIDERNAGLDEQNRDDPF